MEQSPHCSLPEQGRIESWAKAAACTPGVAQAQFAPFSEQELIDSVQHQKNGERGLNPPQAQKSFFFGGGILPMGLIADASL